jgi:hypothetical protein
MIKLQFHRIYIVQRKFVFQNTNKSSFFQLQHGQCFCPIVKQMDSFAWQHIYHLSSRPPYLSSEQDHIYNMSCMAPCLAHVKHGTVLAIKQDTTSTTCQSCLAPVQYGTVLVIKQDTVSTACQSWHSVYYLSSMAPYLSSSMTPCLLPVKQSTCLLTVKNVTIYTNSKHGTILNSCQACDTVKHGTQSFACSSMALCSPPVKHGAICSSLKHGTIYLSPI